MTGDTLKGHLFFAGRIGCTGYGMCMSFLSVPFSGFAWDRGGMDRREHAWLEAAVTDPATRVVVVERNSVLVDNSVLAENSVLVDSGVLADSPAQGDGVRLAQLTVGDLHSLDVLQTAGVASAADAPVAWPDAVWLGRVDGQDWVAVPAASGLETTVPAGVAWADVRRVAAQLSGQDSALAATSVAILAWSAANRFCSRCGESMRAIDAGWVRVCGAGHEEFPRLDPAVIVRITDDADRVLLGHNAAWEAGRFSIFAGFVEPGESFEDAVRREMREEVGLELTEITYRGSQPWPFPRSLMVGFTARAASCGVVTQPDEIDEARWFSRDELREAVAGGVMRLPGSSSISYALLADWYGEALPEREADGRA